MECIPKLTYVRQGDKYILDAVCTPTTATEMDRKNLKYYTDTEIRQIYYCKSYLNVQRISDICTADGEFILLSIMKGERSIRQCASRLEEIWQKRPEGNSWTIWRRFLNTICTNKEENTTRNKDNKNSIKADDTDKFSIGTDITKYWSGVSYTGTVVNNTGKCYKIRYEDDDEEELNHKEVEKYMKKHRGEGRATREVGQRMRLWVKLGDWNKTAKDLEITWPFYFSLSKDILYRSYREEWHRNGEIQYDCHNRNEHYTYQYSPFDNTKSIPDDAVPTDVMDIETGWRIANHLPIIAFEGISNTNKMFMDYLSCQEEYVTHYYTQIDFQMVPQQIYELFKSTNRVNIATDGGAIPLKGSIGFVIANEEGQVLSACYDQPSGNDPLSFWSEICAFLAVRLVTLLINQYYDGRLHCPEPARSKIQVYTDSLSMIKKLEAYDKYPTAPLAAVLDSEWDVLSSALHRALTWFTTYPKIN
jgi:hypothetical protein